jgi:hypothetical protein
MVTVEMSGVQQAALTGNTRVRQTVRAASVAEAVRVAEWLGLSGVLVVSVREGW